MCQDCPCTFSLTVSHLHRCSLILREDERCSKPAAPRRRQRSHPSNTGQIQEAYDFSSPSCGGTLRQAEGRKKPGKPAAAPSEEPNPKAQRNFTDPESRIMRSKVRRRCSAIALQCYDLAFLYSARLGKPYFFSTISMPCMTTSCGLRSSVLAISRILR